MSEITKKVAYLRGMAEGMDLKEDTAQNKLLLRMLETLDEMAEEMEAMEARQDEAEQYLDELDADLGDLEEYIFPEAAHHHDGCDCGCEEDEDCCDCDEDCCEDDEDAGEDFLEYECPHCGASIYYDQEAFDLEEEHLCPDCGKELFPISDDE